MQATVGINFPPYVPFENDFNENIPLYSLIHFYGQGPANITEAIFFLLPVSVWPAN